MADRNFEVAMLSYSMRLIIPFLLIVSIGSMLMSYDSRPMDIRHWCQYSDSAFGHEHRNLPEVQQTSSESRSWHLRLNILAALFLLIHP
jgi:hypothetical protein